VVFTSLLSSFLSLFSLLSVFVSVTLFELSADGVLFVFVSGLFVSGCVCGVFVGSFVFALVSACVCEGGGAASLTLSLALGVGSASVAIF